MAVSLLRTSCRLVVKRSTTSLCLSINHSKPFQVAYTHNRRNPEDKDVKTSKQLFEELMSDIEAGKSKRAPELIALLGKNVNKTSSTGDTPLIHIIKFANTNDKKHLQLLKAIVESPYIDVNQAHHQVSNTPLHFLLSKNQYNNQGSEDTYPSDVHHTLSNDTHLHMLDILLKLDMKNKLGDTPLHIAADHGDLTAIRSLTSHNAIDVNVVDARNKTAAQRAEEVGHITVAEMLRKAQKIKSSA